MKRKHAATAPEPVDLELEALRNKWSPEWRVWRSLDDIHPCSWCATRRGQGRELNMTLVEPTAEELEAALRRQELRR